MTRELGQSIGNIVEKDQEEINFEKKVGQWVEGKASYVEVRQSIPSHDRPLVERVVRSVKGAFQAEEGEVVE